ncbi:hypothetical protein B7939_00420 [Eggerthia catenaformis]|nr:hypothetical protein B7939_00420 [Eggerthia catenaformis]
MRTIAIEFRENSKRYNFNTTDENIKTNDLVLVYSINDYKVVKVVDDDIEFNDLHKNIVCKFNLDLPQLDYYQVYEIITYNNEKYKNVLSKKEEDIINVYNNIIRNQDCNELFLTDDEDTYKVIINSLQYIEFEKIENHDLTDSKELLSVDVNNDEEKLKILKMINTSFLTNDDSFYYHPVAEFIRHFKELTNLKIIIKKERSNCSYGDLIQFDFNSMLEPSYEHYDEFVDYYNKLKKSIDSHISWDEDWEDYIDDYKIADFNVDYFENNFNILAYKEDDNAVITPVLKFRLEHCVNLAAYYDLHLKFQTLDVIINEIEGEENEENNQWEEI